MHKQFKSYECTPDIEDQSWARVGSCPYIILVLIIRAGLRVDPIFCPSITLGPALTLKNSNLVLYNEANMCEIHNISLKMFSLQNMTWVESTIEMITYEYLG